MARRNLDSQKSFLVKEKKKREIGLIYLAMRIKLEGVKSVDLIFMHP